MTMKRIEKMHFITLLNALGLLSISLVIFVALYFQLVYHDIPCPLCLLQRAGLILAGFGFFFNLTIGFRNSHYALVMAACLLTAAVATRQILLHIKPGDPGYSSIFFGLHFYTWSLITTLGLIMVVAGIMVISDLSDKVEIPQFLRRTNKSINYTICVFYAILVTLCFLLTITECGMDRCVDNPIVYKYLMR